MRVYRQLQKDIVPSTSKALILILLFPNVALLYSGKLSREKTFTNFATCESFLHEILGATHTHHAILIYMYHSTMKGFSRESFPLYNGHHQELLTSHAILHTCSRELFPWRNPPLGTQRKPTNLLLSRWPAFSLAKTYCWHSSLP